MIAYLFKRITIGKKMLHEPERPRLSDPGNMEAGDKLPEGHRCRQKTVAFWVTNPCRITRKVKQTKMYVCTLEEFILVDTWIHCCASWN